MVLHFLLLCRVLRSAASSTAGLTDAAVNLAFADTPEPAAELFLRLMYDPFNASKVLEQVDPHKASSLSQRDYPALHGMLTLAARLDTPLIVQVSLEGLIMHKIPVQATAAPSLDCSLCRPSATTRCQLAATMRLLTRTDWAFSARCSGWAALIWRSPGCSGQRWWCADGIECAHVCPLLLENAPSNRLMPCRNRGVRGLVSEILLTPPATLAPGSCLDAEGWRQLNVDTLLIVVEALLKGMRMSRASGKPTLEEFLAHRQFGDFVK